MPFLIGVLILITFICFVYFYFKVKLKKITKQYLGTSDLNEIIEMTKIKDDDEIKSLSGMDKIYLPQIEKDFDEININQLKRMCEENILACYKAIENKDLTSLSNENLKLFVQSMISDDEVHYSDFNFHNTVILKYERNDGFAMITFGSSFEYYFDKNNSTKVKKQDRLKTEMIYVINVEKVSKDLKKLGLNCPNCGSPLSSAGNKTCEYCGSLLIDIIERVWKINKISKYD